MRISLAVTVLSVYLLCSISHGEDKAKLYPDFLNYQMSMDWSHLSTDEILSSVADLFSDLHIIVLDQLNPEFLDQPNIQYEDQKISEKAYHYYFKYMEGRLQGVGFFLAPHLEIRNQKGLRPLQEFPLIVLRKNAPRHAIIHELGHFFIHQWQGENHISIESPSLQGLYESAMEEVVVDLQILNHSDDLNFSEREACSRVLYLNQNIQVSLSSLKEAYKKGLSSSDELIYKQFYQSISQARAVTQKWHRTCFLLKYQKD